MMPDPMIADYGLSKPAKVLYVVLLMLAKGSRTIKGMTTEEIAAATHESRRSFSQQIGELERAGWVEMTKKGSRYFEIEFPDEWPYELGHQSPSVEWPKKKHREGNFPVESEHGEGNCNLQGRKLPRTGKETSPCDPAPYKEARAELNSERQERQEGEGRRPPRIEESPKSGEAAQGNGHPGVPTTLRELAAGMDAFTDDPKQLERLRKKALVWFQRLTACKKLKGLADDDLIDWIHEALSESMDAKDIVKYASAVLKDWMQAGARPRKAQPAANGVVEIPSEELALFNGMYNGKHSK